MKFVQARNYSKASRTDVQLIVIHDMEYPERPTGAEWCADFFAGPSAPKASAHYSVDADSVVQSVLDKDVAWHTPGALHGRPGFINDYSIGVEHAGYAKQTADDWQDDFSTAMLELSAQLVAGLCQRFSIPVVKLTPADLQAGARGICGHDDCTKASGTGTHWDPGPGFPWDWYMGRVRAHLYLLRTAAALTFGNHEDTPWPIVVCDGTRWEVAPDYIAPIAIGAAQDMAASLGWQLPSPALVDAIWQAADLRLDSAALRQTFRAWTLAEMSSVAAMNEHCLRVAQQVNGRTCRLLAGSQKDVVVQNGVLGIYGWHTPEGRALQPFFSGHARGWIDYSQGCRLVRRALAPSPAT